MPLPPGKAWTLDLYMPDPDGRLLHNHEGTRKPLASAHPVGD
jgi:hypothetical protein